MSAKPKLSTVEAVRLGGYLQSLMMVEDLFRAYVAGGQGMGLPDEEVAELRSLMSRVMGLRLWAERRASP